MKCADLLSSIELHVFIMDPTTTSSSTDTGSGSKEGSGGAPKAIIKNVDMSEEMQQESVDIASTALEKYNIEKDIAAQIKKEFDRRHGPTWHVVVGKNFGSYVTHGGFLWYHSCCPSLRSAGAWASVAGCFLTKFHSPAFVAH